MYNREEIAEPPSSFGEGDIRGVAGPLSAAFVVAAVLLLLAIALPALRVKREEAMQE
jgi:TctA family transporter